MSRGYKPNKITLTEAERASRRQQNARRRRRRQVAEEPLVMTGRRAAQRNVLVRYPEASGKVVSTLLRQITLPSQSQPVRIPSVDMPYTALMKLKAQFNYTCVTTPISGDWSPGDAAFVLYGQPGRMLEYGPVLSPSTCVYNCYFTDYAPYWTLEKDAIGGTFVNNVPWPLTGVTFSTGSAIKGPYQPIGRSGGLPYLFLNGSENIEVVNPLGTSTLVGTFNFEIWRWMGRDEPPMLYDLVQIAAVSGVPPSGAVLVNALAAGFTAGYYSVKFLGVTASAGSSTTAIAIRLQTVVKASGQPFIIQLPAPEIGTDTATTQSIRRTACSLLITNTTAYNFRQGTIIAARANDVNWRSVTGPALSPSFVQSLADKYAGDAANGIYTFMELTSRDEVFEAIGEDYNSCLTYDLDIPDLINVICISNPSVSTAANSFCVSLDTVLEFQTSSQRYIKSTPPAGLAHGDLIEARRILNNGVFFFENPMHVADIYQLLKRGWNNFRDNAMPIASVASRFAPPQFRPLIQGMGYALQR